MTGEKFNFHMDKQVCKDSDLHLVKPKNKENH